MQPDSGQQFEVDCVALEAVARTVDDLARQAEQDFRLLDDAVNGVVNGVPGTMSAEAAGRFGQRWNRRLGRLADDTQRFADKLRDVADAYCATDTGAAGKVIDSGKGIPGAAGGGYVAPHSDYGD